MTYACCPLHQWSDLGLHPLYCLTLFKEENLTFRTSAPQLSLFNKNSYCILSAMSWAPVIRTFIFRKMILKVKWKTFTRGLSPHRKKLYSLRIDRYIFFKLRGSWNESKNVAKIVRESLPLRNHWMVISLQMIKVANHC